MIKTVLKKSIIKTFQGYVLLLFSLSALAQTPSELLKKGADHLAKSEYQEALVKLDKAIVADGDLAEAYFVRGKIHMKLLDMNAAMDDFEKAQTKGYAEIDLFVQKGQALQVLGKYKESIAELTKALDKKTDDKTIWFKRALSYEALNMDYEALDDYTKAVKLDNTYFEALLNRCILFYENDNMKAAFRDCDKAIQVRMDNADAYYYRGASKGAGEKQDKEALADFNKALEIDPDHDESLTARGAAKLFMGNKKGACLDWKKASSLGNAEAQELYLMNCE